MTLACPVCVLIFVSMTACVVTEFHACACSFLKVPYALHMDSG